MPVTPTISERQTQYNIDFWAEYFPNSRVVYYVDVQNIQPNVEATFALQGDILGPDGAQPKGKARQALVTVSNNGVRFEGVPPTGVNCAGTIVSQRLIRIAENGGGVRLIVATVRKKG